MEPELGNSANGYDSDKEDSDNDRRAPTTRKYHEEILDSWLKFVSTRKNVSKDKYLHEGRNTPLIHILKKFTEYISQPRRLN
ncbi:hypothetical protein MMC28_001273 [Mycoblastus sanguinarius]|nr:hypothetical protein [Mycoblastus sanguinarius]